MRNFEVFEVISSPATQLDVSLDAQDLSFEFAIGYDRAVKLFYFRLRVLFLGIDFTKWFDLFDREEPEFEEDAEDDDTE